MLGLYTPEDVPHREDDVRNDGHPKGVGADQGIATKVLITANTAKISETMKTAVVGGDKFISSPPRY